MKVFGLLLLVLVFLVTPVVLLDSVVMPQLMQLQTTYSQAEQIAQSSASR